MSVESREWRLLREPFAPSEIEWRVQSASSSGGQGGKGWAMVLAYVTNRAIMNRLDDVFGPDCWKNEYTKGPVGGVLCGISVKLNDEWVTKWDGAENTDIESVKGGLSDAMKRAAVQWGIGRYLYKLDAIFAEIVDKGKPGARYAKTKESKHIYWVPPTLPKWALPDGSPAPKQAVTMKDIESAKSYESLKAIERKVTSESSQIDDKRRALMFREICAKAKSLMPSGATDDQTKMLQRINIYATKSKWLSYDDAMELSEMLQDAWKPVANQESM